MREIVTEQLKPHKVTCLYTVFRDLVSADQQVT